MVDIPVTEDPRFGRVARLNEGGIGDAITLAVGEQTTAAVAEVQAAADVALAEVNDALTDVETAVDAIPAQVTTEVNSGFAAFFAANPGARRDLPFVVAAAIGNLALTGTYTVDSRTMVNGERYVAPLQTVPSQNGIYIYNSAGAHARATDMDAPGEFFGGTVYVTGGTTNVGKTFACNSVVTTVGTSPVSFAVISDAASEATARAAADTALSTRLDQGGVPAALVPSYANIGGTGDRTGLIGVTFTNGFFEFGAATAMVDGNTATTSLNFVNNTDPTGKQVIFDFRVPVLVTEVKMYQTSIATHGTMKWRVGATLDTLVDVGASFVLGGALTNTLTTLSANTTKARYLVLEGVSGTMKSSGDFTEFEFKIAGFEAKASPSFDGGRDALINWPRNVAVPAGYTFSGVYLNADIGFIVKDPDMSALLTGTHDVDFDFSDLSTMTVNGSDQITEIRAKGADGFKWTQPTGASAPVKKLSNDGIPIADFRSGKTMLANRLPFKDEICYMWSVVWGPGGANSRIVDAISVNSNNSRLIMMNRAFIGTGFLSALGRGSTALSNQLVVMHMRSNVATGAGTISMTSNGYEATNSTTIGVGPVAMKVGTDAIGGNPANGLVQRIIIVHRKPGNELTAAQISSITNFLQRKYCGLAIADGEWVFASGGQSNEVGAALDPDFSFDAGHPRVSELGRFDFNASKVVRAQNPLSHQIYANTPTQNTFGHALGAAVQMLPSVPTGKNILLVPSAQGATRIAAWQKGHPTGLYADLIDRTLFALQRPNAVLKALWFCQGEGDANDLQTEAYFAPLMDQMIADYRADVGIPNLPVVWTQAAPDGGGTITEINSAIANLPSRVANTAFVSNAGTSGMTIDGGIHYNAAAQRLLYPLRATATLTLLGL